MGLMPSKLKAGGSRQGCLRGAPGGAGHLPGRAKLVVYAFIQERRWKRKRPSQENKTCTLITYLSPGFLTALGGADTPCSPRQGNPGSREARLLVQS